MASLLYTKNHPDEGIQDLLNGENVIPNVSSGSELSTKGWKQEALLRLTINKAELDVSQYFGKLPSYQYEELVDWISLREKISSTLTLADNETLIIDKNRIIDTIETSTEHPRAIFLNSEYKYFDNFESSIYPYYEKMTKESINYSGINEFFEEQYKIFDNLANENFDGSLDGKLVLTSGFGIKGTAQATAINEKGGVALVIELNDKLVERRLEDGFCSRVFYDTDSAIDYAVEMKKNGFHKVIGLVGNASEVLAEIVNRGIRPNIVTDATPSGEPFSYLPSGYRFNDIFRIKRIDPDYFIKISNHSMMLHAKAMLDLQKRGSLVFEFGDNLKMKAYNKGLDEALGINDIDSIINKEILNKDLFMVKWFAISNIQEDIFVIDDLINGEFYDNPNFARLINTYSKFVFNKNLPSRKLLLDKNTMDKFLKKVNELIRNEELSAPILVSISKFNDYSNDESFFKDGFIDTNALISKIDLYKNVDFVNLSYYGNQDKYHKLEQKDILLDGSDSIIYKLNSL